MVTHSMESGTLATPCMVSKSVILVLPSGHLACRQLAPRIMDMYTHQTIHSFVNNLVYSKYLGWLSAEAGTRVGVGACLKKK